MANFESIKSSPLLFLLLLLFSYDQNSNHRYIIISKQICHREQIIAGGGVDLTEQSNFSFD